MGFVMLGIATLTSVGINAAIFAMVAHGVITGMLFFEVGSIYDRYHTRQIAEIGGGLQRISPHLGAALWLTAIASLGLPGLAGFWGDVLVLLSAFNPAPGLSVALFRTLMVFGGIGTILVVLVLDAMLPADGKWLAMPVSLLGVLGSLAACLTLIGQNRVTFGGMYRVDSFALLFKIFFLVAAVVVLGISLRYFQEGRYYQGEYYTLLLASFLGCLTMPSSRDLLMLFISLELVSAPGFLIAAFRKTDPRSNEAGLKFFLIGVLS